MTVTSDLLWYKEILSDMKFILIKETMTIWPSPISAQSAIPCLINVCICLQSQSHLIFISTVYLSLSPPLTLCRIILCLSLLVHIIIINYFPSYLCLHLVHAAPWQPGILLTKTCSNLVSLHQLSRWTTFWCCQRERSSMIVIFLRSFYNELTL